MTAPPITAAGLLEIGPAPGRAGPVARGPWSEAWSRVFRRPRVAAAAVWLAIVAFFAAFGPFIASGHPLVLQELSPSGELVRTRSPLLEFLAPADIAFAAGACLALPYVVLGRSASRSARVGHVALMGVLIALGIAAATIIESTVSQRSAPGWALWLRAQRYPAGWVYLGAATGLFIAGLTVPFASIRRRALISAVAAAVCGVSIAIGWGRPLASFDYIQRESTGAIRATYTLIPWSPAERFPGLDRLPPMTTLGQAAHLPDNAPPASRRFILGTDGLGQDVLSQLLSASRLAISIGLVSTGIAVLIGVTLGAVMGYFGGWVDLVLFRIVEVFMGVPVLFLLIVAAAVLPPQMRSTYVMMAIIGCCTWTGAARFTRAEFLKLRSQDFVQAARAAGLPLPSILFRHMLPSGVTPVLVDASFAIGAAITAEATLSFLGLGPIDQPSWGRLLAGAVDAEGQFRWWLAAFPGAAIFLTVLSYNIIGESLRDAMDPRLTR